MPGALTISDCIIEANGPAGIRLSVRPAARGAQGVQADSTIVEDCVISYNDKGIWRQAGDVRATWCQFYENSDYGVLNEGLDDLDARLNCWGHPSGPGGVGPGLGDAVSDRVLYYPWLANGVRIASSSRIDPTAHNNARRIVRDECPPFYKVVYTHGYGVWIVMASDPIHGPWTEPVEIWPVDMVHHSTHPGIAVELNDPVAAGKPYSTLHLVWSEHIPDESAPGEIYYSWSGDGGFTWSVPANLSQSVAASEHPSIGVDGTNIVHVVWEEWETFTPDVLYTNNSVDGWTPPVNISLSGMPSIYPAVATNYAYRYGTMPPYELDDRAQIVWTEFGSCPGGGNTPWVAYRSFDPVSGWVPPLDLAPEDATRGSGGAFPSIIAYASPFEVGRAPAVVWQWPYYDEQPPMSPSDIFFNERTPGVWGNPRPVWTWIPDGAPSRYASLALEAGPLGDTLWVAWEEWDTTTMRSEIYSSRSADFGDTWNFYLNLSQTQWDLSLHPSLAYQKGWSFDGLYDVCWTEVPLFGADQHVSQVYYIGATALKDSIYAGVPCRPEGLTPPPVVACMPNPAASQARFSVSVTRETPIDISICDVRGRLVRELNSRAPAPGTHMIAWDGRDSFGNAVGSGLYLCRVRAAGRTATTRVVVLR